MPCISKWKAFLIYHVQMLSLENFSLVILFFSTFCFLFHLLYFGFCTQQRFPPHFLNRKLFGFRLNLAFYIMIEVSCCLTQSNVICVTLDMKKSSLTSGVKAYYFFSFIFFHRNHFHNHLPSWHLLNIIIQHLKLFIKTFWNVDHILWSIHFHLFIYDFRKIWLFDFVLLHPFFPGKQPGISQRCVCVSEGAGQ